MSDTTHAPATPEAPKPDEAPKPNPSTPPTTDAPTQEVDDDQDPDWRKDFDPDKAAERIRKIQSENKNLRDRAKQAEEKAKGVDEKDQRISALERTALAYEVGYEIGLPKQFVTRLQGNTREELIADAEQLLQLVGTKAPPTRKPNEALRGGGQPEQEPEETDLSKIGSRMFRR